MTERNWLQNILNIRREEYKPVFLMILFSFFIGLSLTFYFTASNAIFVKHFPAKMIPVSFIASGILVYLAWWLFSKIDKRSSLSRQVTVKFVFVFISVLAISIGVWAFESDWLVFVMYTWVRVMVYITLVNFWGLAGRLFNLRQGKRIFGLISVGEVISIIIGYFSIPFILKLVKVSDLLFMASISLSVCVLMVIIVFRTFKAELQTANAPSKQAVKASSQEWNYWNLLKKPYFVLISLMALLPIFGYLFVDYLFLAQSKREFAGNPAAFASFLGIFLGAVAILELIFKLFSGRFLNRFGLKPSLLLLPIILITSIFLAAVFGTLYGMVGMFFAFIAMARLFERSVRGSFYEPAFQLLYQPVPTEQRLPFQNQIEGIPKAMGTVITGCVILIFSSIPAFNLVHLNWLFIIALGLWIWIAVKMYDEYRNMLKTKLSELKQTRHTEEDPMVEFIRKTFTDAEPAQYQKLFEFFEKSEPAGIGAALAGTPALSFLREKVENDHSLDFLADLARSTDSWERRKAARQIGASSRYSTYILLINLLKDPDPSVKKEAIISSGKIRRVELWPSILENLTIPQYAHSAAIAAKMIGEPILQDLDRWFDKISSHKQAQLNIISIYKAVGDAKVIRFLRAKIHHPDKEVQFQVMLALSHLKYHASASEMSFIRQSIEDSVATIAWTLASLIDIGGTPGSNNLQLALLEEVEEKKEQLFLLLSLLYDSKTIGHIRSHIESTDSNAKIYALEISDMMISTEIKELFFPVFEDLPVQDRLNRLSVRFPQEKLEPYERLDEIINMDYSRINHWTKACALGMLPEIQNGGPERARELLAANLVNPDPLLSEMAAWVLYRSHPGYFSETIDRFEKSSSRISGIVRKIRDRENNTDLLLFEKIQALKNSDLFALMNETVLLNLLAGIRGTGRRADSLIIPSDSGIEICIPNENLYEMMTGDPVLTERYIRYCVMNKHA